MRMTQGDASDKRDRLFIKNGLRHYRRTYSLTEVRIGAGIVAILLGIGVWIAWKGAHPDPSLYEVNASLNQRVQLPERAGTAHSPGAPSALDSLSGARGGNAPHAAQPAAADRGPLPAALAPDGWREGTLTSFGPDSLYEKINGRADYYKVFGFKRLWFLPLSRTADEATTIDIEVYELSSTANALGAYAGERPPDAKAKTGASGLSHVARNALMSTSGPYYVRAIGSDESRDVLSALGHLEAALSGLSTEPLPWAYALLSGTLGFDPGKVSYLPENAFSFGFARDVYSALGADESELFVAAAADPAAATALAKKFEEGFASYGEPAGQQGGVKWIKDQYIQTISGTAATGTWVVGVRGAPDKAAAAAGLQKIRAAVEALPPDVAARARAAAPKEGASPSAGYGEEAPSGKPVLPDEK